MTHELFTLIATSLLTLVLPLIYGQLYSRQVGQAVILSNRENAPEPTGAAGRGLRAHRNLLENLPPFAALILTAHVMGVSNFYTVAAAYIFLAARLTHATTYLLGITGIRTAAYLAGTLAMFTIALQLFI